MNLTLNSTTVKTVTILGGLKTKGLTCCPPQPPLIWPQGGTARFRPSAFTSILVFQRPFSFLLSLQQPFFFNFLLLPCHGAFFLIVTRSLIGVVPEAIERLTARGRKQFSTASTRPLNLETPLFNDLNYN